MFKLSIPKLRTICFLTVSVIVFISAVGCTDNKNYLHEEDIVSSNGENILLTGMCHQKILRAMMYTERAD